MVVPCVLPVCMEIWDTLNYSAEGDKYWKQMVKLYKRMAFQPPSARQELANRKILEELQLKKQLLLKQGVAPTLNSSMNPSISSTGPNSSAIGTETHVMTSSQRALQHAQSQSFGSFVAQDSLFGNLILPVLPRFDNKQ